MPAIQKSRMFWRVLWRLMSASRGPLFLALVAVATGAAVCAALLDLDLDVGNKLTHEFRTLGANVVVSPPQNGNAAPTMDESILAGIAARNPDMIAAPYLYLAAQASPASPANTSSPQVPMIVAGTWFDQVARMNSWWKVDGQWIDTRDDFDHCMLGSEAARQLGLNPGSKLTLQYGGREASLTVVGVVTSGSSEDNQAFISLGLAQQLAMLGGQVGMVQLSVPGTSAAVQSAVERLSAELPGYEVRPVRQLAAAEGALFNRIHALLFVTISIILVLTVLGVLASTAGLALERRHDVGLMKALGGTVQRVMRFFLVEATALGLVGGVLGCAAGILLAGWIGQRVFAAGISPRWPVWPLTVGLMIGVALAGALPLRLLGRTRPAEILRSE